MVGKECGGVYVYIYIFTQPTATMVVLMLRPVASSITTYSGFFPAIASTTGSPAAQVRVAADTLLVMPLGLGMGGLVGERIYVNGCRSEIEDTTHDQSMHTVTFV